ncbi:DNA-binding transcriptional regulator, MocR family, contains an aminotransferase domain [bacterium A37T11]|nr:DNA-binding transcriptional regulator, MocR family, contains an aminotransferase domain [bacterium A37T11]
MTENQRQLLIRIKTRHSNGEYKYQAIVNEVIFSIQNKWLSAGDKLPTWDEMHVEVGWSKSTIMQAADQLKAGGYIKGNAGAGSIVLGKTEALEFRELGERGNEQVWSFDGSVYPAKNRQLVQLHNAYNAAIKKAQQEGPSDPANINRQLCEVGRKLLYDFLAVQVKPNELLCLQHRNWINRALAASLAKKKERVNANVMVMLTPGCSKLAAVWKAKGYRIIGLPLIHNEFNIAAFEALCQAEDGVDVLYLMPRYHFPTMVSLPKNLLEKMVAMQQTYPFYIIEDDIMAENWDAIGVAGGLFSHFPDARLLYMRGLGRALPDGADVYFLAGRDLELLASIAAYLEPLNTTSEQHTALAVSALLKEGVLHTYHKGMERRIRKTRGWITEVLKEANLFMEWGIQPEVGLSFYLKPIDRQFPAGIKQRLKDTYQITVLGEDDFFGDKPGAWGIRLEAGRLLGLDEKAVKEQVSRVIAALMDMVET